MDNIQVNSRQIDSPAIMAPIDPVEPGLRHSRMKLAVAFAVAAASDVASVWTTFSPPLQWAIDGVTAIVLFVIFGRRWALLPGLVAEAIPGLGVFPFWVLVVGSIALYDKIKRPRVVGK